MPDPITYTSISGRFGLPFLFAGQAQKEFYINKALATIDALLHPLVEGESDTQPATPVDGECWLIGSTPSGDWSGNAGYIACRQADSWIFVQPRDGLRIFDKALEQERFFSGQWFIASAITPPTGGTVIDGEARTAIGELIDTLTTNGLLPPS